MKHLLIIIIISLVISDIFAQNTISYYKKINEGKIFTIESDFESAIHSYQTVFKNNDFVFARDCYNAIELTILAKDSINLEFFIYKAVMQGIHIDDLEKSLKITNYLTLDIYEKLIEKEDSLLTIYSSRINKEIRTEINQMFLKDQELREKYYNTNIFEKSKIRKKWEALNAIQVKRIMEITKQYGFPGEKLIGIDRNEMHPKIRTHNYSAGMPIVILIHHFSQPNLSYDNLLIEEVKKGNLYNEHFATICDFEAKFGKNKYETFGYYGLRHQPKRIDKQALNLKREEIGMLKFAELDKLNQVQSLTKFWNWLY